MSEKLTYTEPRESTVTCEVTFKPGPQRDSDANFPSAHFGLIVKKSKTKGIAIGWNEYIHHLRWALKRSPEMRKDVQAMLAEVEEVT